MMNTERTASDAYRQDVEGREMHERTEINEAVHRVLRRIARVEDDIAEGFLSAYENGFSHALSDGVETLKSLVSEDELQELIPGFDEKLEDLGQRAAASSVDAYISHSKQFIGRPHRQETFYDWISSASEKFKLLKEHMTKEDAARIAQELQTTIQSYESQQAEAQVLRQEYLQRPPEENEELEQQAFSNFEDSVEQIAMEIEANSAAVVQEIEQIAGGLLEGGTEMTVEEAQRKVHVFREQVTPLIANFVADASGLIDEHLGAAMLDLDSVIGHSSTPDLEQRIGAMVRNASERIDSGNREIQEAYIEFGKRVEVQATKQTLREQRKIILEKARHILREAEQVLTRLDQDIEAERISKEAADEIVRGKLASMLAQREQAKTAVDMLLVDSFIGNHPPRIPYSLTGYAGSDFFPEPGLGMQVERHSELDEEKRKCKDAVHAAYFSIQILLERFLEK